MPKIFKFLVLAAVLSMGIGYYIGFSFFEKKPVPPFDLTKDAPLYVCFYYSDYSVGSCDKFVSEEMVSGLKFFQIVDGFTHERRLVGADNRRLFYLISK